MTAEFPYLITNRICAPLELCAEESDEWQGRTQRPKRRRQERQLPSFLSRLLSAGLKNIWFSSLRWVKRSYSSSRNYQVFVSGHLLMFSLPVMKAVTGVSALGGNGGLFIPLKAQYHTCFAQSVICNCGISWEALEQSTLCSGRDPSQIKHVRQNQRNTPPKNSFYEKEEHFKCRYCCVFLTDLFFFLVLTLFSLTVFGHFSWELNCLFLPPPLPPPATPLELITLMQTARSNCDEYLIGERNISLFNLHQHKDGDSQSGSTNRTECPSLDGSPVVRFKSLTKRNRQTPRWGTWFFFFLSLRIFFFF